MALGAALIWEVRTTGNTNNGGAFRDVLPGTSVDYSQQNAAQKNIADGACPLGGLTVTTAAGGMTTDLIGNLWQVTAGVNFSPGFYEVVAVPTANTFTLDRTPCPAGIGAGGTGSIGGALDSPLKAITNAVSGNKIFVKLGVYNAGATWTYTNVNVLLRGYDASRAIRPTGANRPTIHMVTFQLALKSLCMLENFIIDGSNLNLVSIPIAADMCIVQNCKITNTAVAGTACCISGVTSNSILVFDCELIGTAGATSIGVKMGEESNYIAFNYFHNLTTGITGTDFSSVIAHNTFSTEGTGISFSSGSGIVASIMFNNFYNQSSRHVYFGDKGCLIYGNTLDTAVGAAIEQVNVDNCTIVENNDFWNNGISLVNLVLDQNNIGLDPLWVNPGVDFDFQALSPNKDQALGIRLGVG